jgi:nicotinamide-nucleotide amidase
MLQMWPAVSASIQRLSPTTQVIRHRCLKCFGVGESDLERRLPDMIRRGREPSVGITVSGATITLRITAAGATDAACQAAMAPTVAAIHECLGTLVFGEGEEELQHAVVRLLNERRQSLAVIEWGTAGLITHWLREGRGGEQSFVAGIVVSDVASAQALFHMASDKIGGVPCSLAMAESLAAAGRETLKADYTLAISDFPSDEAAGDESRFHIALATPGGIITQSPRFAAHPSIQTTLAAKRAVDFLRLTLLQTENSTHG